jgi:hypothetical protein
MPSRLHTQPFARTLVLLTAAACAPNTPEEPFVSTTEISPPVREGSAEPFLSQHDGVVYLSWLEPGDGDRHRLRMAQLNADGWSEARTVRESDRFFVNWADFPSVTATADGTLWAHWLERGRMGGYDYGVRVVRSTDGGAAWSEPWTPHDDDSPTEHGFVSMVPLGPAEVGMMWLDGRKYLDGAHGEATEEMTLRYRTAGGEDGPGPETLVDGRVCDCCQTDMAMSAAGPVAVYRDRTDAEIRDIYVTRRVDGAWTEGAAVHDDGWEIAGCPVNGPAVAARDHDVAVAWFTGAGNSPRVKVAFSRDGGATFAEPLVVDDGNPVGRVDILFLDEGEALVSWLEQTGAEAAAIRVRKVGVDGPVSASGTVLESSSARASGFPRLAPAPGEGVVLAWTDVSEEASRVRVMRLNLAGP